MTRYSLQEYAWAIRDRYRQSNKAGKTKISGEFTKTTGLHHKAAIRPLNRIKQSPTALDLRCYEPETAAHL